MEQLNALYFGDMFGTIEKTFNDINSTLSNNREEIKEMAYRTQMNEDDTMQEAEARQEERDGE